nr:hypothetical protein [Tanacetum cinerariifolium]
IIIILSGPASVDFNFSIELVMKRVAKSIKLMGIIAKINDPQCELLLLRACAGISKLYFSMRTCSLRVFEMAQHAFNAALCSALERIVTASGPGFGDWQWRLATFPFAFGLLGVYCAGKEVDIGLGGGCDKPLRPADMLLYSWDEGLDVCVDLMGKYAVNLLKRIRKFSVTQDIGVSLTVLVKLTSFT